jgi:flagellar hook assembly protein FlgD
VLVVDSEGVGVEEVIPEGFKVHSPYPNPFNPSTAIRYELPNNSHVEVVVYDILGRKVKIIEDSYTSAGVHEVVWNGIDNNGEEVSSGVYLFKVKAGEFIKQGKMVLVR